MRWRGRVTAAPVVRHRDSGGQRLREGRLRILPSSWAAHRYFFKLYALDAKLTLPPQTTKADLLKAIEGHVLGQTELIGRYKQK